MEYRTLTVILVFTLSHLVGPEVCAQEQVTRDIDGVSVSVEALGVGGIGSGNLVLYTRGNGVRAGVGYFQGFLDARRSVNLPVSLLHSSRLVGNMTLEGGVIFRHTSDNRVGRVNGQAVSIGPGWMDEIYFLGLGGRVRSNFAKPAFTGYLLISENRGGTVQSVSICWRQHRTRRVLGEA